MSLSTNIAIATAFNKQFTTITPHTSDPRARQVKRRLNTRCPLDRQARPFTTHTVGEAVRNGGNSRAVGPEGLTVHHLKHLGPLGLSHLTHLFNLSYSTATIPDIWKTATIIPLLEPGKPSYEGSSYRAISILCPSMKILERLLLPELNSLPLSKTQHGFRQHHSTTTALLPLAHKVALGFNPPRPPHRTVTVSVDFSKAFDTVSHTTLISSLITQTTLRHNTVRWLSSYLRGRMASCQYNNIKSPHRHAHTRVPQGSCISPALFNFFVSSYPSSPQLATSYADDFTVSVTAETTPPCATVTLAAQAVGV